MTDKDTKPMTTESSSAKPKADTKEVDEYAVPTVELTRDDQVALRSTVRTADDAQQMFLNGEIDEDEFAKAVALFGKPSNPSETVNRADDAYEKKLPKWAFTPPEGTGLTYEERAKQAEASAPKPGPMTHEQIVSLPPEEQAKAAEEKEKAEAKSTSTSSTPDKSS